MEWIASFAAQHLPARRAWDAQTAHNFDDLRDQVFRLAYALTLNYSEAEDLAQDCLIRIWSNRDKLQQAHSPQAWVTQVVVNRVRTHWRRKVSWLPLRRAEEVPTESDPEMLALKCAMEALPTDYREVALLVGVYGASYADAALTLNIPEGTVGSRFNKAKQMLREALEVDA